MLRLWRWYQNCSQVHPLETQMISSGAILGVADIAVQAITRSTKPITYRKISEEDKRWKIDWEKVARAGLFGFVFLGPVGHFWYERLDHAVRRGLRMRPNSFKFAATKVGVECAIFMPLCSLVRFARERKSVAQAKEDTRRDFPTALGTGGKLIAQFVCYRNVPEDAPWKILGPTYEIEKAMDDEIVEFEAFEPASLDTNEC